MLEIREIDVIRLDDFLTRTFVRSMTMAGRTTIQRETRMGLTICWS